MSKNHSIGRIELFFATVMEKNTKQTQINKIE